MNSLKALLALLVMSVIHAQDYQSSFAEQKYDRVKGPTTLHGGVAIDGATGALSMNVPFGMGIGARGVVYRPQLSMRWAPQGNTMLETVVVDGVNVSVPSANVVDPTASLSAGRLSLRIYDYKGPNFVENYELFNGITGSTSPRAGTVPQDASGNLLPKTAVLLTAFGYTGSVVELNPHQEPQNPGLPPATLFERCTSDGGLLLGLSNSDHPLLIKSMRTPGGSPNYRPFADFKFPSLLLLIKGDVAYEFQFDYYTKMSYSDHWADLTTDTYNLYQPNYRLHKIVNRLGESIAFSYNDTSLPSYTATWKQGGSPLGPSITVAYTASATITVTYSGGTGANPSYTISGSVSPNPNVDPNIDDPWLQLRVNSVTQDYSGESIQWAYTRGSEVGYGVYGQVAPAVIQSIRFPNRILSFDWKAYPFARNKNPQEFNGAYVVDPPVAWFWGVTKVTEQALAGDNADGPARITTHDRTIPCPDPTTDPNRNGTWGTWTNKAFNDVIHHPDGTVSVNYYAALGGTEGGTFQVLMHIKHALVEERHYTTAKFVANDTSAIDSSSCLAFKRVRYSAWDLKSIMNPSASLNGSSQPYPTKVESWETNEETTIYKSTIQSNWDGTNFGWQTVTESLSLNGTPKAAWFTQRTINSDLANWYLGRVTREQKTIQSDTTGFLAAGVVLPKALPAVNKAFEPSLNVLQSVQVGDSTDPLNVATTFGYGTSGLAKALPQSVTLSGSGLQSGQVGIQAYLYDDPFGHLRSIQQSGASWTTQQATDGLGLAMSQTDANGNRVSYGYDNAGRLTSIQPSGEQGTTIQYNDSDHRGVKITRGSQVVEYRYNGFGVKILERRTNGSMTSYRMFGYDAVGRPTCETVWTSERQTPANESLWSSANLALAGGTTLSYDDRGRVTQRTNPNGEHIETGYQGLTSTQTIHARVKDSTNSSSLVTSLTKDVLGRLVEVTDTKMQKTTYKFDASNRVVEVHQTDAGSGVEQIRKWAYDDLGRLVVLDQPESGVTYFTAYTVTGKPTKAYYGLPAGWRPASLAMEDTAAASVPNAKLVTTALDLLGRPTTVSGLGVSQSFRYDIGGSAAQANGKLVTATDGGVMRTYVYGGLNGRLSELDTTVPLIASPFVQTFAYDSYGHRTQAKSPSGATTDLDINLATGLPNNLKRNGSSLIVTPTWDEGSWMPINLAYGNGASTILSYRTDKASLASINHYEAGCSSPTLAWTFQFDQAGRLLQDGEDQFQYDELGRLWRATLPRLDGAGVVVQSFDYDGFGNMVSSVATGAVPNTNINNFTFNTAERARLATSNRLPSGTTGAVYDAQGNLTQVFKAVGSTATLTMSYDALGRVTSVADSATGLTEVYQYTTEGLRTVVEEWVWGVLNKKRYNIYNDARQLIFESELVLE